MAREPTPTDSSDVPPYTPTGLISSSAVFATEDLAGMNETVTADLVIANETSKPRRRRKEDCPLSSHSWVLWVLWLYCSALFAVEIVELLCLWSPLLSLVWFWIQLLALCLIRWWLTWTGFPDFDSRLELLARRKRTSSPPSCFQTGFGIYISKHGYYGACSMGISSAHALEPLLRSLPPKTWNFFDICR